MIQITDEEGNIVMAEYEKLNRQIKTIIDPLGENTD